MVDETGGGRGGCQKPYRGFVRIYLPQSDGPGNDFGLMGGSTWTLHVDEVEGTVREQSPRGRLVEENVKRYVLGELANGGAVPVNDPR
jgi:hypothetical protein